MLQFPSGAHERRGYQAQKQGVRRAILGCGRSGPPLAYSAFVQMEGRALARTEGLARLVPWVGTLGSACHLYGRMQWPCLRFLRSSKTDSHGTSLRPQPGYEIQGVGGRGRGGDACSCTGCLGSQQVTKAPPLDCLLYGYSYDSFFFFLLW